MRFLVRPMSMGMSGSCWCTYRNDRVKRTDRGELLKHNQPPQLRWYLPGQAGLVIVAVHVPNSQIGEVAKRWWDDSRVSILSDRERIEGS
jgi:hypothetical protein